MPGFCDLGSSQVDIGRLERRGFPEAVFSEGKSPEEVASIVQLLAEKNGVALATRANRMQYEKVRESSPDARFESAGRCIVIERDPLPRLPGRVAVVRDRKRHRRRPPANRGPLAQFFHNERGF